MNILIKIQLVIIIMSGFACNENLNSQQIDEGNAVDSLIVLRRINERVLIVSFGSDAVTFVKTDSGIVVIDAGISTGLTLKYRKIAENQFGVLPFIYVINTHGHHDHYRGNNVFDKAIIIGHANMDKEIDSQWSSPGNVAKRIKGIVDEYERKLKESVTGSEEWKDSFITMTKYSYAYKDAADFQPVRKPDIKINDSLFINAGELSIEMKYFGNCHSQSDVLVYIPSLKLLFSGDLFSKYGRPSIEYDSENEQGKWKESAAWLKKRNSEVEMVITGHGQILEKNDLEYFINAISRH